MHLPGLGQAQRGNTGLCPVEAVFFFLCLPHQIWPSCQQVWTSQVYSTCYTYIQEYLIKLILGVLLLAKAMSKLYLNTSNFPLLLMKYIQTAFVFLPLV